MSALAIAHTESSCGWGGQELRVLDEASGFISRGHAVTIAAPPESRLAEAARKRGVPLVELPIARKSAHGMLAMRAFLASRRIDIINTHSSTDSWLAALATLLVKSPPALVRTRHISAPFHRNVGTRWLYRRAAHIVTTGNRLRESAINDLGLRPDGVSSVSTGIDLLRFQPGDKQEARRALGLPGGEFIVGIVATLRSWKGHRFLVDAFVGLESDTRLLIVGAGPGDTNLRRQVADLGLGDRVVFAGNQDDVVPWLRAMDVFVLPSYANEGIPQAIMQAQACGIPVISTEVGSIGEVVTHEATGLLVQVQDAHTLQAAIRRLMNDADLRASISSTALTQARQRYSDAIMIDRMAEIFQRVARPVSS